ncbi:MAG: glutamate--tRNA ligase [Candidatus Thermoplasmatota archaeon]
MDVWMAARLHALENAVRHKGQAQAGAVLGRLMAQFPELKERREEAMEIAQEAVEAVNAMSSEGQRAELSLLSPHERAPKRAARTTLPDLPGVSGKVVMRLAPNPSGLLHIGHTRMAILNDEYVKRYGGLLYVRMEDTNPAAIMPEAYEQILKDLEWLGVTFHEVIYQSDRIPIYYKVAEELIARRCAYVCCCDPEVWRALRLKEEPCPHRSLAPEEHMERWKGMLDGSIPEGEAVLVMKTDLSHKNPAVRDFVAMRINDQPHARTMDRYRVYPNYNFSVAVDDHMMEMTHVLRGKDHINNTYRQEYIYEHMGWPKPVFIHYGWVSIKDAVLKKSLIKGMVREGEFTGWDDVRLGTVRALAGRGIPPEAIRRYWVEVGIKSVDIHFSWENLYAYSRAILDPAARRYFFVPEPMELEILGAPEILEGRALLHPDRPEEGVRHLHPERAQGRTRVFVSKNDLMDIKMGEMVRLKDLCNVRLVDTGKADYAGNDLSVAKRSVGIIQWLGAERLEFKVWTPDGEWHEGYAEPGIAAELGSVVQFERFGFVRIHSPGIGYFAHR